MSDFWRQAPLETFLDRITYGFTNPMPTTDSGPFMVTAKDINDGRILYDQARRTSIEAYRDLLTDKSRPVVGDVLVTKDGTLGRMAVVDRSNVCINQSVALLKPNEQMRSRFLKYLLEEPRNFARMLGDADGSTIRHIYITRLAKMEVRVPDVGYQDRLVEAIGSHDDKIDLNRRMNQTLEAIAQAVFRDWFIDFGPVRRKMNGATDPCSVLGGLVDNPKKAADVASLFPTSLGDDGLPEGWVECDAEALIEFNPKEKLPKGTSAPYSDMASLPTSGSSILPPIEREFASGMRFRNGDALLARITPCLENGKAGFVDFLPDDSTIGWGSTEFFVLRSRPPVPKQLSYCLVRHPEFKRAAEKSMTGTSGRQRAQVDILKAYKLARATDACYAAFGDLVTPIFSMMRHNSLENKSLSETRDLLLPKLMSGEILLRDAEAVA